MTTEVLERFSRFAREEAPGRSALYAEWAAAVVASPDVAAVLARIPAAHRQPPLVFALTRFLGATEGGADEWCAWLLAHADVVVAECSARSLQTNEPLRCAALLPALSLVDGPIALLELGVSAGLCLYPDRYSYRYTRPGGGVRVLDPRDGAGLVTLESALVGTPTLRVPDIVWRAGIDLDPRDARDVEDRRWITGLVWPGEVGRRERIEAALDVVALDPPRLVAGDVSELLAEVAATAPVGATLVVTTPGVLPYVPRVRRQLLIDEIRGHGRWITIDAPDLHDSWTSPVTDWPTGKFVLALDGEVLAAVDPLGASVEWRAG